MGPVDFVRVNNTVYSWTSCKFAIDGMPTGGIVAVDYEQKRERKIVYSNRQDGTPVGWTSGKYSVPSFSIKMLRSWADTFTTYLTAIGLGSYGDAEWAFSAQLIEPALPIPALPLILLGSPCTIIGEKDAHEEGIDELLTEYDIACLAMTKNGKQLWSAIRSLP